MYIDTHITLMQVMVPASNLHQRPLQCTFKYTIRKCIQTLNAFSLMVGECTFKFLLMNPSDWLALAVMVLICLSHLINYSEW